MQNLKQLRFFSKKKFSKGNEMFFNSRDSIEQSTPEKIALYRAKRLKCDSIADLCCGIGMDSIALAKNCNKVFAIDFNEKVLEMAKKNAEVYGVKNIEFIHANALSIDLKKLKVESVFADPSRRKRAERVKTFWDTLPRTDLLIQKIMESNIENFCIEISRDFNWKAISMNCEKEFISQNNELNSISLYFGEFKKCEKSVTVLPAEERLESNEKSEKIPKNPVLNAFLFELDDCIVQSEMQKELSEKVKNVELFSEQFFTSEKKTESPFFRNSFQVLSQTNSNFQNLLNELKKLDCGKVVLRGSFLQQPYQERIKAEFEENLVGKEKLHVFFIEGKAIICKNLFLKD